MIQDGEMDFSFIKSDTMSICYSYAIESRCVASQKEQRTQNGNESNQLQRVCAFLLFSASMTSFLLPPLFQCMFVWFRPRCDIVFWFLQLISDKQIGIELDNNRQRFSYGKPKPKLVFLKHSPTRSKFAHINQFEKIKHISQLKINFCISTIPPLHNLIEKKWHHAKNNQTQQWKLYQGKIRDFVVVVVASGN